MAKANNLSTISPSRFHNLSDPSARRSARPCRRRPERGGGRVQTFKDEFKRRGLVEVAGDNFTVTATEQIVGRLDSRP